MFESDNQQLDKGEPSYERSHSGYVVAYKRQTQGLVGNASERWL